MSDQGYYGGSAALVPVDGQMAVPGGGTARAEFGALEVHRATEVSSSALVAQAQAEVQSRYIVALQRPRNVLDARSRMLAECKRAGFAEVAIYRKPIGGGKAAEGLSIRFAEVALRAWRNVHVSKVVIADDDQKRTVRVTATDLESNVAESVDVVVEKFVERKQLRDGQRPIRSRVNSYGDLVHLVPADEGSMLTKQKAEVAKAKREVVLALIPGDILEECRAQVRHTQQSEIKDDPTVALKRLCDAFAGLNVRVVDLEEYLGHSIENASPAEIEELRGVHVVLREGEANWPEILQAKVDQGSKDQKGAALRQRIRSRAEEASKKKRNGRGKGAPTPRPSDPGAGSEDEPQERDPDQA